MFIKDYIDKKILLRCDKYTSYESLNILNVIIDDLKKQKLKYIIIIEKSNEYLIKDDNKFIYDEENFFAIFKTNYFNSIWNYMQNGYILIFYYLSYNNIYSNYQFITNHLDNFVLLFNYDINSATISYIQSADLFYVIRSMTKKYLDIAPMKDRTGNMNDFKYNLTKINRKLKLKELCL